MLRNEINILKILNERKVKEIEKLKRVNKDLTKTHVVAKLEIKEEVKDLVRSRKLQKSKRE